MFNITKYKNKLLITSGLLVVLSIIVLILFGFNLSADFIGETSIEVEKGKLREENYQEAVENIFQDKGVDITSIEETDEETILMKTKPIDQTKWEEIKGALKEKFEGFEEKSFETTSSFTSQDFFSQTLTVIVLTTIALAILIGWRFKNKMFGVITIVAMLYAILVVLGSIAVFGRIWGVEIDVRIVVVFFSALIFSVYNVVILYDRIRETQRRNPKKDFQEVINLAIQSILVRSLGITLSISFILVALAVWGGESIFWYAIVLLIGMISGVYCSLGVLVPLLVVWNSREEKKRG